MNTDFTTTRTKLIDKLVSFVINQTFGGIDNFVSDLTFQTCGEEEFNKEAYLDLSKPYTYNWNNPQGYTKKDN
jgi:hypothetical protein